MYTFDCYRGDLKLVVQVQGEENTSFIYSQEGTTQGDIIAPPMFCCGILPLIRTLKNCTDAVHDDWVVDETHPLVKSRNAQFVLRSSGLVNSTAGSDFGTSGAGAIIYRRCTDSPEFLVPIWKGCSYLAVTDADTAHYEGLILGVLAARQFDIEEVEVQLTSDEIFQRINKGGPEYTNSITEGKYHTFQRLRQSFRTLNVSKITETMNQSARELASKALSDQDVRESSSLNWLFNLSSLTAGGDDMICGGGEWIQWNVPNLYSKCAFDTCINRLIAVNNVINIGRNRESKDEGGRETKAAVSVNLSGGIGGNCEQSIHLKSASSSSVIRPPSSSVVTPLSALQSSSEATTPSSASAAATDSSKLPPSTAGVGSEKVLRNPLHYTANIAAERATAIVPEPITYSWNDAKLGPRRCAAHGPKCYFQACKSFVANRIFYLSRRPCPWHIHGECPHVCPLQDATRAFLNGQELERELAHANSAFWDSESQRVEHIPRVCLDLELEEVEGICPTSPLSEKAKECPHHGWKCDDLLCDGYQANRLYVFSFRKCCWHGQNVGLHALCTSAPKGLYIPNELKTSLSQLTRISCNNDKSIFRK